MHLTQKGLSGVTELVGQTVNLLQTSRTDIGSSDWVSARKKCNVRELFDLLKKRLKSRSIYATAGRCKRFQFLRMATTAGVVEFNYGM